MIRFFLVIFEESVYQKISRSYEQITVYKREFVKKTMFRENSLQSLKNNYMLKTGYSLSSNVQIIMKF